MRCPECGFKPIKELEDENGNLIKLRESRSQKTNEDEPFIEIKAKQADTEALGELLRRLGNELKEFEDRMDLNLEINREEDDHGN